MGSFYGVLPIHVLRNKSLSAQAKILYMEITSRVGVNGRMKFNLHGLAMSQGVAHYIIKSSLNDLAKAELIWRIDSEISLSPPDSQEFKQMELDLEFVGEVIRKWNETFKRELPEGVKQTASLSGIISDALNSFSKHDLLSVIDKWYNYSRQDKWWGLPENKMHRANLFKLFSNGERLNQILNWTTNSATVIQRDNEAEDSGLLA